MENDTRKNVLIVDNSPVLLKIISHTLERAGYEVKTAGNGLEALEILESYTPSVIFTDLIMPKISGEIFCRIIRSRPEFNAVLLVVLSAVAAEEEIDYVAFGADVCIAKGPAKNMCRHVLQTLQECKPGEDRRGKDEVLGMEGVFRREITTELLSVKRHFEITLEHMADGFVEMTSSAKIIYVNKKAAQLLRRPREELLSSLFYDHFNKKYRPSLVRCVQELERDPVDIGENEAVMLHGLRVHIKFIPVFEKEHQSVIVLMQDITRRKDLERQIADHLNHLEQTISLRTREYLNINKLLHQEINERSAAHEELAWVVRQFETVLDSTRDLIAILDQNLIIVRVNAALAKAHHAEPSAFIGKPCDILMHGNAAHQEEPPHVLAARKNESVEQRIEQYFPGRSMHVSCVPLRDDLGTCIGFVQIARDVC